MEQIQVVNNNGSYDCNINITTEEWIEILRDSDVTTPKVWKALLGFYHSPDHTASCSEVDPENPYSTNPIIRHWGERIQSRLERFQVLPTTGEGYSYWIIPMTGYSKGRSFEWTIRPELVDAIEDILIQDAIEKYKQKLIEPEYWEGKSNDPNQRTVISHFQKYWNIEAPDFAKMFQEATAKVGNLLGSKKSHPRGMILIFAKYEPERTRELFRNLFDETIDLNQRIINFKQKAMELLEETKLQHKKDESNVKFMDFQDTNAISTYLWFMYPDKYYKYAYERYNKVNKTFGLQYKIKSDGTVDSMLEGFAMYDKIRSKLRKDRELVSMINTLIEKSGFEYKDPEFHAATIDFGYFISKHYNSDTQTIEEENNMSNNLPEDIANYVNLLRFKKNVILQGAPGTGKTYSTAAIALGILGITDVDYDDHDAIMDKYDDMVKTKQIFFTTFHQSTDYEDFVEGLKPKIHKDDSGNTIGVTYNVEDGIFKSLCKGAPDDYECMENHFQRNTIAALPKIDVTDDNTKIYKVSLGWRGEHKSDSFEKGYIKCYAGEDFRPYKPFKELKQGDIVIALSTSRSFDAIGVVTSDPYKINDPNDSDNERRNVKWVFKGKEYSYSRILKPKYRDKEFSQWTVHSINKEYLDLTKLQKLIDIYQNDKENIDEYRENEIVSKPVVLIIDEINRGNVSKIFGELVTLLEKDKRDGGDHPITVTLPYSKEKFSVPSNVYIIGTMNTTDRSTGTIDYAVRRRFAFVTLKADEKVLPENSKARALFKNIEAFINKYHSPDMDMDDLMVGHSYFMADKDVPLLPEEQLKLKILYEVIPLLKEYCNDGLLTCNQDDFNNHIKAWEKLEIYKPEKSNTTNDSAADPAQDSETEQSND